MKNVVQPDPVRTLIVKRSQELGETLASLSKKMGLNHAYLQQFVQRGTPRELPERSRIALASLLQVEEAALRGPFTTSPPPQKYPPSLLAKGREVAEAAATTLRETIPLMGQGAAGRDGVFPFNGEKVADVPAPPAVARVRDAFAIYVVGDSMLPRYESGEIVYVDPTKPAVRGDYVVVQLVDAEGDPTPTQGFIKQYVGRDEKNLKLLQLNPKKNLSFPLELVHSLGVIVLAGRA